jgi:hypothetical protein
MFPHIFVWRHTRRKCGNVWDAAGFQCGRLDLFIRFLFFSGTSHPKITPLELEPLGRQLSAVIRV